MKKRYQIFISSTFVDLVDERSKVMEAILKLDCFPACMELFTAMDEEIFEYIKRIIDDSDFYLLIIGGRYGSTDDNGISWTEKEYDYAVSKGIPVLVFDHKDFTKLPANRTDQDDEKRKKLLAFKKKAAKGKLINMWTDENDLAYAVATSLTYALKSHLRIGWVRTDKIANLDTQVEAERLKAEITNHNNEVNKLKTKLIELEADIKKKDADHKSLESKYQVAQQEIEQQKKKITSLEVELNYKNPKPITEKGLQPQTESFTVKDVTFKMVHVEGGTFTMGANTEDKDTPDNEIPAHQVTLSDYWIGETLVTNALWRAVMSKNPILSWGNSNHPVANVSWTECKLFIKKLNKITGRQFRLPTEAEWEFSARGGNPGKENHYLFAGSDNVLDVAWFGDNSKKKTHPVRQKNHNELGLYDMSGNVWEWCNDWYSIRYYSDSPTYNPSGPSSGTAKVIRGGSWKSSANYCCVSFRNNYSPANSNSNLGLRLAL